MAQVNEINVSRGGKMAEGEATGGAGGGGGGGKLKMILIVLVLLLLLGGGGAAGIWMFLGSGESAPGHAPAAAAAAGQSTSGDACPTEQLAYVTLGDFVVNLADGRRYLKTKIDVMICEEAAPLVSAYLTARMAEIKDLVISELQTLNSEQLRDQKERELLRQRLLRRVESILPNEHEEWEDPNPIKKVLITEFYLQ